MVTVALRSGIVMQAGREDGSFASVFFETNISTNMMAISRFTKSTLLLLTLELLNPLGGFVEETFCLLLDVHDLLVDVAQTSSPQRANLLLQLDVLLLRVVETLEGLKKTTDI